MGKMARKYLLFGEKMAVKYADELIVLSPAIQKYFVDKYGRKPVLLPNGIDRPVHMDAQLIRGKYSLEKDGYILYTGRIVPGKGLEYLIHAFKKVKTDKKLIIAGGASDSHTYMKGIEKMAEGDSRIIFTGFVQGRMLEELYSNAYFFVFPSDLEGMPMSLLEAMSYGNCCLVSDIPECTAVIGDRGVTFKRGDTHDLYNMMQSLCKHPEKTEEYKKDTSDFVCEKYNWDDIVEKTLRLYRG